MLVYLKSPKQLNIELSSKVPKDVSDVSVNYNPSDPTKAQILVNGVDVQGGGTGKNWIDVELNSAEMMTLSDGGQVIKTINAYDPSNFKNDYINATVDTSSELVGKMLNTGDSYSGLKVNIVDVTEGGQKVIPEWYTTDIQKLLDSAISNYGFDFHYYKTVVLYGGTSTEDYVLQGELDSVNDVYVQDVSQQYWETNVEDGGKSISTKREELQQEIYGSAYVVCINKMNAGTRSCTAFLICYYDSQASYLDGTSVKWANLEAGKSYPVTFDTNTERWMVRQVVDDTREGHEGEKIAVELTDNEKNTYFTLGWSFTAGLTAAEIVVDNTLKLKTPCIGNSSKELIKIFSWNDPFSAPTEIVKYQFIGRPAGLYSQTYTWYDEDGTKHIEEDGEYVWDVEMYGDNITVVIPKNTLNTMIVEVSSGSSVGSSFAYGTTELYRHTFTVLNDSSATFAEGEYKLYCSFMAVNAQQGDNYIDYIMYSDVNYSDVSEVDNIDWVLPATGKIGIVGASATTWYDVVRFKAGYILNSESTGIERCLKIEYIDSTGTVQTANVITPDNISKYIGRDFRSVIANVMVQ